jgi:cyclopropane-fatty-acyl-phospholipid synthase
MNLQASVARLIERTPFPDALLRIAIERQVADRRRSLAAADAPPEARFAAEMATRPIAEFTRAANEQHYELPPEFFGLVLGPRRKYSCCLYDAPGTTLAEAEDRALEETAQHADLADGQSILELGCGWGSLSLFLAERMPRSRVTAVSNSAPQRRYIEGVAAARGLANLTVITADMNEFDIAERFDRIVSVEMFEHMANWRALLTRAMGWLAPDGRLFLHVFSHRSQPYRFDHEDASSWISQHFFTGGIMPSHGLIRNFADIVAVEAEWRWSGTHYQRTALDWLANYDAKAAEIAGVLRRVYGADAGLWTRRWRLFFLAVAGLFGHRGGEEWGVSRYRLRRA